MNKKIIIFFAAGMAVGFLAAKGLLSKKYMQQAQEEIDSVKETFRKQNKQPAPAKDSVAEAKLRIETKESYRNYTDDLGYSAKVNSEQPRIISPEDFGEVDGYDQISLTYYSDETLTDDQERPMDDKEIEDTIGRENLKRLFNGDADAIYIRNDRLKADYEVLRDLTTYAAVLKDKPYLAH